MRTRTWPYGTQFVGKVAEAEFKPGVNCLLVVVENKPPQGFVIIGGDHAFTPKKDQTVTIEFTKGGPYGGYWRVVK